MLGKLLKYEFKALSAVLLPIFAAILLMGIIAPLFVSLPDITGGGMFFAQLLMILYFVIYACVLFGGGLMCLIVTVIRFKRNLLGDEGFLMHTLPVKKWQLTAAKVIAAAAMQLLGGLTAAVSGMIFIAVSARSAFGVFSEIGGVFPYLPDFGVYGWLTAIEGVLIGLMGLIGLNLMLYASMCAGHMANSHKGILSVGAFVGFYIISQFISSAVYALAHLCTDSLPLYGISSMQPFMITALLLYTGYAAAYFALTSYLMKRKLNIR